MRIDSTKKLLYALAGIIVGFYLPEIWNFIVSLFGG